jgi:UDP-GlcNAc3NAcA epimerase
MKIVSIVGARPNFVKLAPIHNALKKISEHTIIHTGQHYDYNLSKIFFSEFNIPEPTFDLEVGSKTPCNQIGEMLTKIDPIFASNKFDLCIVYGDTNSTIAGAMSANKTGLKLAHVESGLRSFDREMPEEINRVLTDQLSDFLFAPTLNAVKNLKAEKIYGKIYKTGDISVEVIGKASKIAKRSSILKKLNLQSSKYLLLTMHRAENTKEAKSLLELIKSIEKLNDFTILFPIHPRTLLFFKENNLLEKIQEIDNLKIIEPLGFLDFIKVMENSEKIITDSGGVQKESFLLGIPCITIRKNTEWIETTEMGFNLLTGMNHERIVDAVKNWKPSRPSKLNITRALGEGKTSTIIKEIIQKNLLKSNAKGRISNS